MNKRAVKRKKQYACKIIEGRNDNTQILKNRNVVYGFTKHNKQHPHNKRGEYIKTKIFQREITFIHSITTL